MEDRIFLKRKSPKPLPTKGFFVGSKSFATHACIIDKGKLFEVNVWDLRKGSIWNESSSDPRYYNIPNLTTLKEAKNWLVEYYGGTWVKE